MKQADILKLHKSSTEELLKKRLDLHKQLVVERQLIKQNKQQNVKITKNIKYQIAVINTIIKENQIRLVAK